MALDESLLAMATDDDERAFAAKALDFLANHATRRTEESVQWGVGEEKLALFHETSGEQERAEADAARKWQRTRWNAGFGWITGPREHGGRGLRATYDRLYHILESAFDVPDMSPLRIGLGTVEAAILAHGTREQIAEFAVGIRRGEMIACQLFSEPEAGSDLAGVRTRGTRHGHNWQLDGQKVWTSNAQFADIGLALVRTDPQAPKHRGLTMFIVPMSTPGVEIRPLRQMTGGSSFCEVFLTGVTVDDRYRIGAAGSGWKVATDTLAAERRASGDRSHEVTARAVQLLWMLAQRCGRDRDPLIRDAWARTYAQVRSARFQQLRMQARPENQLTGAERALDKMLLVANLRRIGDLALELLGPSIAADSGEWGTFSWNRWLMGALGYRIAGGTDEVLRNMVAERVLGLPREPRLTADSAFGGKRPMR
jgi:alkylation response protein AidB-like acyl-CoA dehydrogenase